MGASSQNAKNPASLYFNTKPIYQIVHFKCVQFIICQKYPQKLFSLSTSKLLEANIEASIFTLGSSNSS